MLRPPATPPEPCWQVSVMRGKKAERLGEVRAKDEAEAIDRAMVEFEQQPWQLRRVLVWRDVLSLAQRMPEYGQPRQRGPSASETGRNRCGAEDFGLVPGADGSGLACLPVGDPFTASRAEAVVAQESS